MKTGLTVVILTAIGLLLFAGMNFAQAQWPAIKNSGYAITTNWHGIDVPPGSTIVATAGTTDLTVTKIRFLWHAPDGTDPFDETINIIPLTTPAVPPNVPPELTNWAIANPGVQYLYAQSTHGATIEGDWGIQAFFLDSGNIQQGLGNSYVAIRAASFNAIPEVPVIGSIGASIAMFAGLAYKKKRKKA
jgi:hypothetical protein